jgi:uncharacterized membrane protein YbhN (UPF0104 family)
VLAGLFAWRQFDAAATRLLEARGFPLLVAVVCAPIVLAASAGAWRSVLASCGVSLDARQAWGCYGLGSVANTFLPGRAGDALRIEVFSRRLSRHGGRWLACGVSAAVAIAQSAVFGCVVAVGALLGVLPSWIVAPAFALPAAAFMVGRFAVARQPGERIVCLATPATLSVLAWARVLGWVVTAAVARLLVVGAVLDALAVPHPASVALVAVCGLALGNALPVAPGATGVAAATMAVVLGHAGLPASTAVAAALSVHALGTGAALFFGACGWLVLRLAERSEDGASVVEPELLVARGVA